ncbi:hypothetical protein CXX84_18890 [Arthrobacter sp. AFG7.2]|nr:hypothetical protein CXX84_18890 [Arthrobacter sp. AFG7.2]
MARALMGRRTLVWGHIHPQAGPSSKTALLRRGMRRIANGTISYTYRDAEKALSDLPGSPVWTAPNSLYRKQRILPAIDASLEPRDSVVYVGRFAPEKKVALLVEGFAVAAKSQPDMKLILIGGGSEESNLRQLASQLGVEEKVEFAGWIDELEGLKPYYGRAFCSASPGFAGLGLTQSLGFGIPMLVADAEPHSPEIELEVTGGVSYFSSDSKKELAEALHTKWEERYRLPDALLSDYTKVRYSAEAMARGLQAALEGRMLSDEDVR